MKQIRISFKIISAIALLALIAGCATTQTSTQSKESMLVASGFKTITPKTAAQQQKLQTLPPRQDRDDQERRKNLLRLPGRGS